MSPWQLTCCLATPHSRVMGRWGKHRGCSRALPCGGLAAAFWQLKGSLAASFHPDHPKNFFAQAQGEERGDSASRTPPSSILGHPGGISTASPSLPGQAGSLHWDGISMAAVEETRLSGTLLVRSTSNGCAGGNSRAGDRGVKGQ